MNLLAQCISNFSAPIPIDGAVLDGIITNGIITNGILAQAVGDGVTIAIVGLCIVFAVLIFLSLFIAALPHIVAWADRVFPAPDHSHADHAIGGGGHPESQLPNDVVIAAIGYVLHTELQKQSVKK